MRARGLQMGSLHGKCMLAQLIWSTAAESLSEEFSAMSVCSSSTMRDTVPEIASSVSRRNDDACLEDLVFGLWCRSQTVPDD
eukprot:Skav206755  [mRNA]  locus=scaffold167:138411:148568:- [translate_table: standard]